jgi:hypothetical protein
MVFGFSKKERQRAARKRAERDLYYRAVKRGRAAAKAIFAKKKKEVKPSGNGMVRKEK